MRPFWSFKKRAETRLLGAPLAGFHGIFEENFGDPETPTPYPRVTPSRVGSALLSFKCPACRTIIHEFSDHEEREHYKDPQQGFFFCPCPDCRSRFYLNEEGMPLPAALPAGANVAPCRVERGGKVSMAGGILGTVLGTLFSGTKSKYTVGIDTLARSK